MIGQILSGVSMQVFFDPHVSLNRGKNLFLQRKTIFAVLMSAGIFTFSGELWGDPNLADTLYAGLVLLVLALLLVLYALQAELPAEARQQRAGITGSMVVVLVLLMASHTWVALHHIHESSRRIDCYTFQQDAVDSLWKGENPYSSTHANIYNPDETARYYGPGMVVNGRVQVGLQYPPLTLLPALVGSSLGDVRYGYLLAILVSALLLAAALPGWRGILAAGFALWNPLTFLTEGNCWTEPLAWMLLCLVVFAAYRKPGWLPVCLGLLVASKQYNLLILPLSVLLLENFSWKQYLKQLAIVLGVAVLTAFPFLLWNVRALWYDLVQFHLVQPYRKDAVSLAVPFPWILKLSLPLVLLLLVWIVAKVQPGRWRFTAAYGVVFLLFFVTAKQAFCNYYFLISQLFLLAAAECFPGVGVSEQGQDESFSQEGSAGAVSTTERSIPC
ncbi:hypothetical protein ACOBR2_09075 [Telmatobacter bradus]|uniref:hypothetical protein n=1 Tax=Telmatobacter bradus TaxID=474953 RepID=UPI003B4326F4